MKRKESGYSMLELSVALGIAAIIAAAGIIATTAFMNDAGQKTTDYAANADESIRNAEDQYLKTLAGFWADNISELEDVNLDTTTAVSGNTLFYDGNFWSNGSLDFEYLAEVELTNLQAGEVLSWDGSKWVNAESPAPNINNLTDVQISGSQSVGSALVWDGTNWVDGPDGTPGATKLWADDVAPEGWLIADGSAVSRTTYAALFATIGTTYGSGNGSTTFNLPDFSGRTAVGLDSTQTEFNTLGKTGGNKTHTLTVAEMPSHTHTQQPHGHTGTAESAGAHTHTGSTSTSTTHEHTCSWSDGGTHNHTRTDMAGASNGTNSGSGTSRARADNNPVGYTMGGGGSHTHTVSSVSSSGDHSHTISSISSEGDHTHGVTVNNATAVNENTGGGGAHNNLQPYITMNYIIKY